ncbi:unnamed protein product, partial [Ectocarpus sp. 12 AP-2014]
PYVIFPTWNRIQPRQNFITLGTPNSSFPIEGQFFEICMATGTTLMTLAVITPMQRCFHATARPQPQGELLPTLTQRLGSCVQQFHCGPRLRDDVPAIRIQAWTSSNPRISIVCPNSSPSHACFNRRAVYSTRGSWRLGNEA